MLSSFHSPISRMRTQSLQNNPSSFFFVCSMCSRTLKKLTPPFTSRKQLSSNLQVCPCPSQFAFWHYPHTSRVLDSWLWSFYWEQCAPGLIQGHWSGRARIWRMQTPCKRGGSWGTGGLAKTSEARRLLPGQPRCCSIHSTARWSPHHWNLPRCTRLSHRFRRSYDNERGDGDT